MISLLLSCTLLAAGTVKSSPVTPRDATLNVPQCPPGSSWTEYTDNFKEMNKDFWVATDGMGEDSVVYDAVNGGVTFKVRENMRWALINSTTMWQPPMNVTFTMATSGKPGLVNQFVLRDESNHNHEIDLEVVYEGYDTPIWKSNPADPTGDSIKFSYAEDTSKELQLVLGSDTAPAQDRQYRFSHPGWVPTAMTTYSMQWRDNYIAWWAGTSNPSANDPARLTFRSTNNIRDYPTNPLPLHLGMWATDIGADWAGLIDFTGVDSYEMKVGSMSIVGCQSDAPFTPTSLMGAPVVTSTGGAIATAINDGSSTAMQVIGSSTMSRATKARMARSD